jgi:hypothetical protein
MQRLTGSMAVPVRPSWALIRCTALLGLVVSACAFPDYNFALVQGSAGSAGLATGGAATGGSAGDRGGSGVAGEAMSSGGGGTAGMATGEGGAAGSTSGPKACADYAFLPKDCGCFDDAGRAYLLCTTALPWAQAEAQCEFYDMTLVKIESPAENDWILTQARAMTVPAPFQSFWIGGSSIGSRVPGTGQMARSFGTAVRRAPQSRTCTSIGAPITLKTSAANRAC